MMKELVVVALMVLSWGVFANHSEAEVPPPGEDPGGIITPPPEPPYEPPQDDGDPDIPQAQLYGAVQRTQFCYGLIYLPRQGLVYLPGFEPYGWFGVNQGCARFPIAKLSN